VSGAARARRFIFRAVANALGEQMISRLRWVALGAAALLLSACASIEVGKDFDLKAFESHAQRGVTTQDQVRGWLGAPISTGIAIDSNGQRLDEWTYIFAKGELPDIKEPAMKMLQARFDAKGILYSFSFSASSR
jgi:outer membrane protein assembly factor BamE (lipoprotein component of BamABCDE complex)